MNILEPKDQDRVLAGWDEKTVVDVALELDSLQVVHRVAARDGLRDESVGRVLEHERAKARPSDQVWNLYMSLTEEQRTGFLPLIEQLVEIRFEGQPVQAAMARKYVVGMGRQEVAVESETADLVAMLLAPEPLSMYRSRVLRITIKEQAIRLAKRKIREEGGSFVVREDGVNPLQERVRPVVEALNAPMAEGLEATLRNVGADVPDHDRTALAARVQEWREKILVGEIVNGGNVLGRLTVGLGVDGFNAFVEVYNHGSKGSDAAR